MDARTIAMAVSFSVALLMLVGKLVAAQITGSAAILSDALESITHLVATSVAAFGIWWTAQPADEDHPYGHGKFAYFSAGFEGALILAASVAIIWMGLRGLYTGHAPEQLGIGLVITASLAGVNTVLGLYLLQVGRQHRALILEANGKDVLTDVWTSVGVIAGVFAVWWTGIWWLDPLAAILVGLNILWTAGKLLNASFRGLMDHAPPQETEQLDACLKAAIADGTIRGFHQVRHRRTGDEVLIEAHLLFDDDISLHEAHAKAGIVERTIGALYPGEHVTITTHLEPVTHDDQHPESHAGWSGSDKNEASAGLR